MPFSYNPLLGVGLDKSIPLDGAGKIPSTFLPSYVDDVEEYNNLAAFPATGETGKIYVAIDTGFAYRWSGSVYVQIGITAAAGATTQVQFNDAGAFGGDSGLTFNKTTDALSAGGFIPTSSTVPANGVYLPEANSVAVATNGAGRLAINSSGQVFVNQLTQLSNHSSPALELTGDAVINSASFGTGNESSLYFYHRRLDDTATRQGSSVHSIAEDSYTSGSGGTFDSTLAFRTVLNNVANERLRITSAGLVGIGTSSPATLLEVRGLSNAYTGGTTPVALRISDNGTDVGAATWSTTTDFTQLQFFSNDASSPGGANVRYSVGAVMETNTGISSALAFRSYSAGSPTERMRITSTGNVGVGTISPAGRVHVAGVGSQNVFLDNTTDSIADVGALIYRMAGQNLAQIQAERVDTAGRGTHLKFSTAQVTTGTLTERLRIDSSGRVGIGTTSPGYTLVLSATSANIEINDFTSPDATSETGIRFSNNATTHALLGRFGSQDFRISNTGNIVFATGGISTANEKARIDSSGRLLIGTSSARSDFFNGASVTPAIQIEGTDGNITRFSSVVHNANNAAGPHYILGKTRSASAGGSTLVSSGDSLGALTFMGADGTQLVSGAEIYAEVDGTPGADDMPCRIVLATTADGASSPTERMRITQNGSVLIGKTSNPGDVGTTGTDFGSGYGIFTRHHRLLQRCSPKPLVTTS
jgi:hypothetical protein